MSVPEQLIQAARALSAGVERLRFATPVAHVYNPLTYAWAAHEQYLRRFGGAGKEILFLGMNPGPFGMAQTGVPFGEIAAVRDWMQIAAPIARPEREHPRRPVQGLACPRSEVSGRRLWGPFAERFGAASFLRPPLCGQLLPSGFHERKRRQHHSRQTPLRRSRALGKICDAHLRAVLEILRPQWIIGVGAFAEERGRTAATGLDIQVGRILHPSPASPAANRDWPGQATAQLQALGLWK